MKRYTLGSSSVGRRERKYVSKVLYSNFISPGPVVAEVEQKLSALYGKKHCLTLNSGQSAIQVALQALIFKKFGKWNGWECATKPWVVTPASTYISTLAAIYYAGCNLILTDVELDTGNMDPDSLRYAFDSYDVDFVVPVHLYGKACSTRIKELCQERKISVLEDACEATLVPNTGWGDILTTSFYSNHLISGGSGGAILTNDDDLDLWCWKLINHGRSLRFDNSDIHQITDKFKFDIWGHSYKWSDVPAAIVKAQLEKRDKLYSLRKRNAMILTNRLCLSPEISKVILPNHMDHCFMMYPIIVKKPLRTKNIIKFLNDKNIEIRRMMPITNQEVVINYFGKNALVFGDVLSNTNYINEQGFYVGCHPELSAKDMKYMADTISTAIENDILRHYHESASI